ncbi:hypothetical protein [Kitasatospora sp. NPDC059827]|uniref:hypothetical protein n=1 Tax=Kitasatospora sp. NPDC059827 TaxID=3346964 RepID=UPI0036678EDC
MFTKKIAAAAVAVAAAGVLGTATSASATGATLYDTKTVVVNDTGHLGSICTSRTLNLAAGSYGWGFVDMAPMVSSTVKLAAGTYVWTDCLTQGMDYYFLDSKIQLKNSSAAPAVLDATRWLNVGSYTFGSFLKPNF